MIFGWGDVGRRCIDSTLLRLIVYYYWSRSAQILFALTITHTTQIPNTTKIAMIAIANNESGSTLGKFGRRRTDLETKTFKQITRIPPIAATTVPNIALSGAMSAASLALDFCLSGSRSRRSSSSSSAADFSASRSSRNFLYAFNRMILSIFQFLRRYHPTTSGYLLCYSFVLIASFFFLGNGGPSNDAAGGVRLGSPEGFFTGIVITKLPSAVRRNDRRASLCCGCPCSMAVSKEKTWVEAAVTEGGSL